jgi:hypothetical protein
MYSLSQKLDAPAAPKPTSEAKLNQELAQAIALVKQGESEHPQSIAELDEANAEVALAEANVLKAKAKDVSRAQEKVPTLIGKLCSVA